MKNISRFINIQELIFDIIIVITAYKLYSIVIPQGKTFISAFNEFTLLCVIMSIEFIIISYLGLLYDEIGVLFDTTVGLFLLKPFYFIIITGLFLELIVAVFLFDLVPLKQLKGDAEFVILLALTAPFLMSLLAGFSEDAIQGLKYFFYVPGTLLLVAVPVNCFIIGYYSRWYWGLLSLPAMLLVLFSPLLIRLLLGKIIKKEVKAVSVMKSVFSNLLFPAIVALALAFWHEIIFKAAIKTQINNKMAVSKGFMIGSLFFSGLLPVRLLMALQPPYRIINTILSLGAFGYFFYNMMNSINLLIS